MSPRPLRGLCSGPLGTSLPAFLCHERLADVCGSTGPCQETRKVRENTEQTDEVVKKSIAEGQSETNALFRSCRNAMHVSIHILSDPQNQRVTRLLYTLSQPLRGWHSNQVKSTRSPNEVAEYYADAAAGGSWFQILVETLQLLKDAKTTRHIGLTTTFGQAVDHLDLDDVAVSE